MLSNHHQIPTDRMQKLIAIANSAKPKLALLEAKKLEKLYPQDPVLKNFIGISYANIGKVDLAVKTFKRTIKSNPTYVPAYTNLANCFFQKSAHLDAITVLKKAVSVNRRVPEVFLDLGTNHRMIGELENAIVSYRSAIELDPKHVKAWINLGNALWENGQPNASGDAYLEALDIMPENTVAAAYLIDTFNFVRLKENNSSPYVKANQAIHNAGSSYELKKLVSDQALSDLLLECNNILKANKLVVDFRNTQIYRMPDKTLNCERHKSIFEQHGIIPKFCFACIKIQIDISQVLDLVRLFLIFDRLEFLSQNIRKCMVEMREGIAGSYKGLVYCRSLSEAEEILKKLQPNVENFLNTKPKIRIKRGCSEFDQAFPKYSEVESRDHEVMSYNPAWEKVEKFWDRKHSKRAFVSPPTLSGISLADYLIIQNWFAYGQKIGDKSSDVMGHGKYSNEKSRSTPKTQVVS